MGMTHPRPASIVRGVTAERDFYAEIGRRVARLRRRKGNSQSVLAHVVGIARPTLANLENGRSGVSAYRLYLIARALDVAIDDVLPEAPERPENELPPVPVTLTMVVGRRRVTWVHTI